MGIGKATQQVSYGVGLQGCGESGHGLSKLQRVEVLRQSSQHAPKIYGRQLARQVRQPRAELHGIDAAVHIIQDDDSQRRQYIGRDCPDKPSSTAVSCGRFWITTKPPSSEPKLVALSESAKPRSVAARSTPGNSLDRRSSQMPIAPFGAGRKSAQQRAELRTTECPPKPPSS